MRLAIPRYAVAFAALVSLAPVASASVFTCEDKVNGASSITIQQFPASLTWELTATDASCAWCATQDPNHFCHSYCPTPGGGSWSTGQSNPALAAFIGAPVQFALPPGYTNPNDFALFNGDSVSTFVPSAEMPLTLGRYADCVTRAAAAGFSVGDGGVVEFVDKYKVEWWTNGVYPYYVECSSKITCLPPLGPTRTIGYFRTHPLAVAACVGTPVDLGYFTIAAGDATAALGLFGANPARYDDGTKRSALDQARVLLARQLLGAVCNARVFGSTPTDPGLVDTAVAALASGSCSNLSFLTGELDAFNNSGDTGENHFGNATPDVYPDPTPRTGASCH